VQRLLLSGCEEETDDCRDWNKEVRSDGDVVHVGRLLDVEQVGSSIQSERDNAESASESVEVYVDAGSEVVGRVNSGSLGNVRRRSSLSG
jgi:hypothetical protein